jgi:hypothetical protein
MNTLIKPDHTNLTTHPGQTEWADLEGSATLAWYNNGSTGEGLTWALNIHNAFVNANVSAFLYWIGAGNTTTNSALILLRKDEVKISKRLWAFAQYSRLIRVGAKRVDASVVSQSLLSGNTEGASFQPSWNQTDLFTSAFLNPDNSITIHIINNSTAPICVNVKGIDTRAKVVRRYLTNEDEDFSKLSFLLMAGGSCGGDVGGVVEGKSMLGVWIGGV